MTARGGGATIPGMIAKSGAPAAAEQVEDVDGERRFTIRGVSWEQYEALCEIFSDKAGLHMTYLEGELELMSPSPLHERWKKNFARLFELWAIERGVVANGLGSTTFRKRAKDRGAEPDECWFIDRVARDGDVPDIVFEAVVKSGGIEKLDVYAGLGVREVWFWTQGGARIYHLGESGYEQRERSALVPGLDFAALAPFVDAIDQTRAVLAFRDLLRRGA